MRTKSLLAAAAILAAGFVTAQAQSNVYSLNVVGYVNVVIKGAGAYNLVCNPLNGPNGNNSLTNIIPVAQDGDAVLTWNPNITDFEPLTPGYSGTPLNKWDSTVNLPPGRGFFYVSGSTATDRTNTFVGEVVQGSYSNFIFGAGAYNLVGSSVPLGGTFTNSLGGFVAKDGDAVLKWDPTTTDFNPTTPSYSGTPINAWDNTTLPIAAGEALFYVSGSTSPNAVWTRNFTVQ